VIFGRYAVRGYDVVLAPRRYCSDSLATPCVVDH
jgi:hypothetical protein